MHIPYMCSAYNPYGVSTARGNMYYSGILETCLLQRKIKALSTLIIVISLFGFITNGGNII